jgi:hypothetical protein
MLARTRGNEKRTPRGKCGARANSAVKRLLTAALVNMNVLVAVDGKGGDKL